MSLQAQSPGHGSNYDAAPRPAPQTVPPAAAEPDKPLHIFTEIDWARKETWLKAALLLGSALLALRAFRQLRD